MLNQTNKKLASFGKKIRQKIIFNTDEKVDDYLFFKTRFEKNQEIKKLAAEKTRKKDKKWH